MDNDQYNALLELKKKYEKAIADLEECKTNIGTSLNSIRTGVEEPIVAPYDLSAGGELWRGSNYDTAVSDAGYIGTAVSNYDGAVDRLQAKIQEAIDKIQEQIDALGI